MGNHQKNEDPTEAVKNADVTATNGNLNELKPQKYAYISKNTNWHALSHALSHGQKKTAAVAVVQDLGIQSSRVG